MTKTQIPNTKKRIIQLLQKNGEMRYTDIKEKIGLTDAAISKNLASLHSEGSIEYEKKGREKFYRLGQSISKIFERRMEVLTNNYLEYFVDELSLDNSDYENNYKIIEEKLGAFFIFTIITSIQTGKNWFSSFDVDRILYNLMGDFGLKIFTDGKHPDEWINNMEKMSWDEYFESTKNMCKSDVTQKNITKMYEALRKKHHEEIKELEKLSKY